MCVHLVGGFNHLEKHWSMGRIVPYIMENKKCSKPPTRYNKSINVYTYVMLSSASIIPHTIEHWKIPTLKPSASEPTWPIPQNPMRCHNCPFPWGQDAPKITVQSTNLRQNLQCLASWSWGFPCHEFRDTDSSGRPVPPSGFHSMPLGDRRLLVQWQWWDFPAGMQWWAAEEAVAPGRSVETWLLVALIRKNGKSRKHTRNI